MNHVNWSQSGSSEWPLSPPTAGNSPKTAWKSRKETSRTGILFCEKSFLANTLCQKNVNVCLASHNDDGDVYMSAWRQKDLTVCENEW